MNHSILLPYQIEVVSHNEHKYLLANYHRVVLNIFFVICKDRVCRNRYSAQQKNKDYKFEEHVVIRFRGNKLSIMKIYGDRYSGNCYKILLLLSILEKPYEWIDIDILKGETKTSIFLDLNPNGKIPVLVLDDGRILSESNAILNYLAESTPLLPNNQFDRAKVLQWQFFEQYSHEPYIAVARFIKRYLNLRQKGCLSLFPNKKVAIKHYE